MEQSDRQHKGLSLSRRSLIRAVVYSTLALTGSIACAQSDNLEIVRADVSINGLPA